MTKRKETRGNKGSKEKEEKKGKQKQEKSEKTLKVKKMQSMPMWEYIGCVFLVMYHYQAFINGDIISDHSSVGAVFMFK